MNSYSQQKVNGFYKSHAANKGLKKWMWKGEGLSTGWPRRKKQKERSETSFVKWAGGAGVEAEGDGQLSTTQKQIINR